MHTHIRILLLITGTIVVSAATLYGAFKVGPLLAKKQTTKSSCSAVHAVTHLVIIENDVATPLHIDAKKCDKLTITNKDHKTRLIAFGQHDRHVAYNNVREKSVATDESLTIELNEVGPYLFHDHKQEETQTTFTVNP